MQQAQEGMMPMGGYTLDKLPLEAGGMYTDLHAETEKATSDGTTILSIKYDGGILLGADSRTSGSIVVGRCSDKLEPIHHRIYCQRSGTSAHTQKVAQYVRYYIDIQATEIGNFPPVESAAKIMRQIIYSNAGRLGASMLCSGWDPYKGYQIYSVNQTGFFNQGDWAMSGSGTVFIKGYFDANYNPNMTLDQAKEFMKSVISLAAFRDSSSGGIIRMLTITKDGNERFYVPYQEFKIR